MPYFTTKQRFKIALGGFIYFIGFTVLIFAFLVVTKTVNVENVLQPDLLVYVIAVVGILDILAGTLLLRSS